MDRQMAVARLGRRDGMYSQSRKLPLHQHITRIDFSFCWPPPITYKH